MLRTILLLLATLTACAAAPVSPALGQPSEPSPSATLREVRYASFGCVTDKACLSSTVAFTVLGEERVGDLIDSIELCPSDSEFFCMRKTTLGSFAVPKRELRLGDQWEFDGLAFTLQPSTSFTTIPPITGHTRTSTTRRLHFLGISEDYYLIRARVTSKARDPRNYFLFSATKGLLGVCRPDGDEDGDVSHSSCIWLADRYGIGSPEFESELTGFRRLSTSQPRLLK